MENELRTLLKEVVADAQLHGKFLNSLSLMENSGARKIAAFEHPVHTSITVLKHAAEEFRHAFYLKKQIGKLEGVILEDYSTETLLAPIASRQLLNKLDVSVCRLLMDKYHMPFAQAKEGAYLLVTYAIEVRADMLYGIYQECLSAAGSKVNVKSIIAEEEGHLAEMTSMLEGFTAEWKILAQKACELEEQFFAAWLQGLAEEVRAKALAL